MSDTVGALHRFEQRLEQMVTGAFARAFRSAVQPMEIAAALQREVDNSAQILSRDRRLAPEQLHDRPVRPRLRPAARRTATRSSRELAAMLHEHAQEQHYMFAGPISMNFHPLRRPHHRPVPGAQRGLGRGHAPPRAAADVRHDDLAGAPVPRDQRHPSPAGAPRPDHRPWHQRRPADRRPRRQPPARRVPGRSRQRHAVGQRGRPRLDQRHPVNGQRVQHAALDNGSVVQIGSTRITVHVGGTPSRGPASPSRQSGPAGDPGAPATRAPASHVRATRSGRPRCCARATRPTRPTSRRRAPPVARPPDRRVPRPPSVPGTDDRCLSSR